MSKRSNTSSNTNSKSFLANIKLSLFNIILLSILCVVFVSLFLIMPVASFTQPMFDASSGEIAVEVSQLKGFEALIGNNAIVGSTMKFNTVVLTILILVVAIIPLNIVANKIVRIVGASVAVIALSMLFFLPKMLFSQDGTIFFHPTNGLMLLIIILTVITALSVNNVFIAYNVKKDVTLEEKLNTLRCQFTEQSTNKNTEKSKAKKEKVKKVHNPKKVESIDSIKKVENVGTKTNNGTKLTTSKKKASNPAEDVQNKNLLNQEENFKKKNLLNSAEESPKQKISTSKESTDSATAENKPKKSTTTKKAQTKDKK